MSETIDSTKFYRKLYPNGILFGRRVNAVSCGAELLLWRLHAIADDYGGFRADATELRDLVFPRRRDLRPAQVQEWLEELAKVPSSLTPPPAQPLVVLYDVAGDRYGCVTNWLDLQTTVNGKRLRKVPRPPGIDLSKRPQAPPGYTSAPKTNTDSDTDSSSGSGFSSRTPAREPDPPAITPWVRREAVLRLMAAYPPGKHQAPKAVEHALYALGGLNGDARYQSEAEAEVYLLARVQEYAGSRLVRSMVKAGAERYIPGMAAWFDGKQYDSAAGAWDHEYQGENSKAPKTGNTSTYKSDALDRMKAEEARVAHERATQPRPNLPRKLYGGVH